MVQMVTPTFYIDTNACSSEEFHDGHVTVHSKIMEWMMMMMWCFLPKGHIDIISQRSTLANGSSWNLHEMGVWLFLFLALFFMWWIPDTPIWIILPFVSCHHHHQWQWHLEFWAQISLQFVLCFRISNAFGPWRQTVVVLLAENTEWHFYIQITLFHSTCLGLSAFPQAKKSQKVPKRQKAFCRFADAGWLITCLD
jgi:hypothetical protein